MQFAASKNKFPQYEKINSCKSDCDKIIKFNQFNQEILIPMKEKKNSLVLKKEEATITSVESFVNLKKDNVKEEANKDETNLSDLWKQILTCLWPCPCV